MRIYQLKTIQELPLKLDEAWDFFATPNNLNKITPDEMAFECTTDPPEKMYSGLIIAYKLKLGIVPMRWVTEIKHIQEHKYFVDEQRFGPYAMWHHEHHFEAMENGNTLMTDMLSYAMPFGFIGRIAYSLYVKKKVEEIFIHRKAALEKLFPM